MSCARIINIPGTAGATGASGANGTNGINAFTTVATAFVVPASGDTVVVEVDEARWIVPSQNVGFAGQVDGQVIAVEFAGSFLATSVIDSTHVELYNLGYPNNAPAGTVIPVGSAVGVGGIQGDAGSSPADALLAANNLSDVDNVATARGSLGLGSVALLNTVTDAEFSGQLSVLKGGTGAADAATARVNLSAQELNALLTALAGLAPTVADRLIYTTGVNLVALSTLTAFARTLLDDATAADARETLEVLPRYGLLGSITGWDVNSAATDTAFTISSSRYRIDRIVVENASTNLTTATGGVFTAAGGGGTTIAADQALSALTASTKFDDLTLQAIAGTDVFTAATLYSRCGTAQGSAATVDLLLFGWDLS